MPARSPIPLEKWTVRLFEEDVRLLEAVAAASGVGVNELLRDTLHQWAEKVRGHLKGGGTAPQKEMT